MKENNCIQAKKLALEIIQEFPKSKNGHPFLTLKNGKKVFFRIFLKKYGINGQTTKYEDSDIIRRIRLVEFFDYITKHYNTIDDQENIHILKTRFYTMIFKNIGKQKTPRWEVLSIYPHI